MSRYIHDPDVLYHRSNASTEISRATYDDYLAHGSHKYLSKKMIGGKWRYYYTPPTKKGANGSTIYRDRNSGVTTTVYKDGSNEVDWDNSKVKKISYNASTDTLVTENKDTGKTYVTKSTVDKNGKSSIKVKDITIDTFSEKLLDKLLKMTTKKGLNYYRSL